MTDTNVHNPQAKYRKDYQAPHYLIKQTNLHIDLHDHQTVVTAELHIHKSHEHDLPLILDSEVEKVLSISVNGEVLQTSDFEQSAGSLTIKSLPDAFILITKSVVDPANNSALEGLYKSEGVFCTQCEAEGFRKITPYLDRPDILSVFTVEVCADQSYQHILANGNLIAKSVDTKTGRLTATWHDPFPKPSYLFALVAGSFDLLEDKFVTRSGKEIALELYVDKGNLHLAHHAMASLIKSMDWDEKVYDLEYDLDTYMIVAVDFFNMGAMENKGLNIFNSKYVLADESTATDVDYHGIESVIAHEYFHNWTGNRITCRDWFQLSLKEGLTVFRDQQFSADMGSEVIERISHANIMRTMQFAEDAGPMSHPIRPDKVIEMNNFYTVTVYDKGAEVIRMLHTLLSASGFKNGMDLYFKRHDGQAVTCDDFVNAMADANSTDLSQFQNWYSQSGTPLVSVKETKHDNSLTLELSQTVFGRESSFKPFVIPIKFEILSAQTGKSLKRGQFILDELQQTFSFDIGEEVDIVLFENFSAPVKVNRDVPLEQMVRIINNASDGFCRWDMLQSLWQKAAISDDNSVVKERLIRVISDIIDDTNLDAALKAEMIKIPSFESLAEGFDVIAVDNILHLRTEIAKQLATSKSGVLTSEIDKLGAIANGYEKQAVANRSYKSALLKLVAYANTNDILATIRKEYKAANNMTEKMACLVAASIADIDLCKEITENLYQQFTGQVLVFDKLSQIVATTENDAVYQAMSDWSTKAEFNRANPNRIRSLYGSFVMRNPAMFHSIDGKGYAFLKDLLIEIDSSNAQLAARLVDPLLAYKRYDTTRASLMKQCLVDLSKIKLSNDLYEKVNSALG